MGMLFAVSVVAIVVAALLLLVLARYTKNPSNAREAELDGDQGHALAQERFFSVARRLLGRMGLEEKDAKHLSREGAMRLEVVGEGAGDHYVVYAFAKPGGAQVDASDLLLVAGDVEHAGVGRGVVITPNRIDIPASAGLGTDLDLVDGLAFVQLIDEHAPELRAEIAGRVLHGRKPARTRSTASEPRFAAVSSS